MAKLWSILSPVSPGKTSFVLNLAYLYSKVFPNEKILTVDFNFRKPDLAAFLELSLKNTGIKTVSDLQVLLSGYQTIVINDFLTAPFEELQNFRVLPGSLEHPDTFTNNTKEQWFEFFKHLKESSDLVLFDTGRNFSEPALQYLITESDLLFVLVEQDPLALLHTRNLLNSLISKGRADDIRLLVLRYRPQSPYSLEYINELLPCPVHSAISNIAYREYHKQFLNTQLLAKNLKHSYVKDINKFLDSIVSIPKDETPRRFKWQLPMVNYRKKSRNI